MNCPLCGKKNFKDLFYKDEMKVVECQICGLIFTNPQLDQKELTAHYDKSYYYSPKKDPSDRSRYLDYNQRYLKGKEKERFRNIFKKISILYPEKGKLLDVGTATGFFVKEALQQGWQAEGVEISRWAADWGRKNLKVKISNGTMKQAEFKPNTFDVVTLLDIMEHVKNPQIELTESSRILKKGGILYIETINFDNWITRYLVGQKYVHMVPKFHLYYFGRRQLHQFLHKAGFKVIDECLTSSSVGDYEKRGFNMYWQYLKLLLNTPKGRKNFALNDVIKIYARKI